MASSTMQTFVISRANLASLPRRSWISLSMVLSVALVVAVLIGFLAMAKGFEKALAGAGSPSIAVVLGGTAQELGSRIEAGDLRSLLATRGDAGVGRDAGGALLVSRELLVPVDANRADGSGLQTVSLRGMDPSGAAIRKSVAISEGRMFRPGSRELVVGARIAHDYAGFAIGDQVSFGAASWTVVGHFRAEGSVFESEIWADLGAVQAEFNKQGQVQTLRAALSGPQGLQRLQAFFDQHAQTPVTVVSEAGFYAAQSERTARLIRLFGWPIALLMAIGATAGALNTMMSSVADRSVEIATLRVLGFSRLSAFLATWFEAALLALLGAAIGVAVSWQIFNGWQATTTGTNNTQLGFTLSVTPDLLLQAGLLAVAIGLVGGGVPAMQAARLRLNTALRGRG